MKAMMPVLFLLATLGSACSSQGADASLSASEAQALTFTMEEEKLARDVYETLENKSPVFSNIKQSEQTHMDAVETLLDRYDLSDPTSGNGTGKFRDVSLQKLYDELVREGSTSSLAALQVGVAIEELDIRDIEVARANVTHNDIANTFDNLTRGSRNHLRTFYGKVLEAGGTYTPRYLDAKTFQTIATSPMETGNPNR